MSAQPDIASVAALLSIPARASILAALLGGEPLSAGELARRARVTPQTASTHLAKLVAGGLLTVTIEGRSHTYRLANARVAQALETLATLAPATTTHSLGESDEARALRHARSCYDHLAGKLGVALSRWMVGHDVLVADDTIFRVTDSGAVWFAAHAIDLDELRRRKRNFATSCLDWSERQPHLAGALGASLLAMFFDRRWIIRMPTCRAVRITRAGYDGMAQVFGAEFSEGLAFPPHAR